MPIRINRVRLAAGLAIALLVAPAAAQAVGPEFTYQGKIETNGSAQTGAFDMQFRLFNAAVGGTQIGTLSSFGGVQVTDGLFTVPLNFGQDALKPGQERWIEIRVLGPGDSAYTTLAPRQKLTAAPFATVSRFPWTPSNNGTYATFTGNFVGINLAGPVSGADAFSVRTETGAQTYGGMYIQTASSQGWPFYGYSASGGPTAWTYLDGAAGAWKVNYNGDRLTVLANGHVGIGTTDPSQKLSVEGSVGINGSLFLGNSTLSSVDGTLTESFGFGVFSNRFGSDSDGGTFGSTSAPNIVLGNSTFSPGFGLPSVDAKIIRDGAYGVFIGGGTARQSSFGNLTVSRHFANDHFGTIAGGNSNSVGLADGDPDSQRGATVSGGFNNTASGAFSTVSGGFRNTAAGESSTISGGADNIAFGAYSTVPGGFFNTAEGAYSFAAGRRARAFSSGSFALADSRDFNFTNATADAFQTRFTGGYTLFTGINASGTPTTGARLAAGSGSWTSLSDADAKHAFEPVDPAEVLAKVAAMPVRRWSYKTQDAAIRHIGPTAQDFHAAFGVGDDSKGITTVDADGVALLAIQGLHAKVEDQAATIEAQRALIQAQQEALEALTRRLEAVERAAD